MMIPAMAGRLKLMIQLGGMNHLNLPGQRGNHHDDTMHCRGVSVLYSLVSQTLAGSPSSTDLVTFDHVFGGFNGMAGVAAS